MGVTGDLLPRILKTAGRKVNLAVYKDGIIDSKRVAGSRGVSDAKKESSSNKRQRISSKRPLRIGLDIGTMVARAAHGHGTMLMDERHLTNYGRSLLQAEANNAAAAAEQAADAQAAVTSEENRRNYVNRCAGYVMKRIHTLKNVSGAEVLVVFDGATPPIKDTECTKRSEKRKRAAEERDEPVVADGDEAAGTKRRVQAARRAGAGRNHGDILVEVMNQLRKNKIPFLVSPYEADGQLAYLSENNMIDLVVTEDSDLIAHGCKSILYKTTEGLGKGVAEGFLVQRGDLGAMGLVQKCLSLPDFSDVMLAVMFVALGCDYCSSLKQIGSVAARDIVRIAFHGEKGQSDEEREKPALAKVFERLYKQTSDKNILTDDFKREYEKSFLEALLMYRHPMIYDPFVGKCVLLRNPPQGSDPELMEYEPYARLCNDVRRREQILGTCHGPTTSTRIAEGWINPRTKRPYENMEIPPTVREPPLSLSASESDEDEETRVHTQDMQSTAAAASSKAEEYTQGPDTQGPDTQDLNHPETQLVGSPAASGRPASQRGMPSQQSQPSSAHAERRVTFEVTFQEQALGIALDHNLLVTKLVDPELAGQALNIGDLLVGINGNPLEEGAVVNQVKKMIYSVPRPITVSFSRRVEGNDDADEGNATTQGSTPLTGSSSSRFGTQPSQFSAESQISPGVRSPNLLDSQPS